MHKLYSMRAESRFQACRFQQRPCIWSNEIAGNTGQWQTMSTNLAFLKPIRNKRKNLHIATGVRVTEIAHPCHNKTAYGAIRL
ncbi:hypothetical protein ANN_19389 [Periplaneta americana]|uniref:Uncharacterized protein n=1 Tax=Periplaneta americana TaxID=6978 RepID=A0ABQ8S9R3_PERAM|nr:hypothetical protein ANN_19389 [Periplaneta americana]